MRLESNHEPIIAAAKGAALLAFDDVRDDASKRADAHRRTGRWADSFEVGTVVEEGDHVRADVGSTLRSARAHELGAYIEAKRAPYLVFNAGDGVRKVHAVRLSPQPAVIPAGRRFGEFMDRRLAEAYR